MNPSPFPTPPDPAPGVASSGVLIQGELHSFHHRAAQLLLPGEPAIPTRSFPALTRALNGPNPRARHGLMAIENSVAGALLTNYLLLEEHGLRIVGEVYMRISHSVLGVAGASLDDLQTLESHPMALAQCRRWFAKRPGVRGVEVYDTAGAAAAVALAQDRSRGAVAPHWCAEAYGLTVLAKAVEDSPHNWTRFVHVVPRPQPTGGDKTSVAFSLPHETGSLARALTALAEAGSSLTKIQSLPLVGKPWSYRFFADFTHAPSGVPDDLLTTIEAHAEDLVHLGTYRAGQHLTP